MRNHLLLLVCLVAFVPACDDDSTGPPREQPPLSFSNFHPASTVIGQFDMLDGRDDAGLGFIGQYGFNDVIGAASWAGLHGPLFVADAGHNRIDVFRSFPTSNGRPISFVIGQTSFTTEDYGRSASRFFLAQSCFATPQRLYLADIGNGRVLIWNPLPEENRPANVVVGQADFESKVFATDAVTLDQPVDVMEVGGKLYILDAGQYRLLIYNSIPTRNGAAADVVVGQPDFITRNIGGGATGFGEGTGFWTDGRRLAICDNINDRVMIWSHVPTSNGVPADIVVGAPDFNTIGSNAPSATSIGTPFGVGSDGRALYVADSDFNRVLVYDPFPTASFPAASRVIGQSSFTNATGNDDDQDGVIDSFPTGRTLLRPTDVTIIGRRLLVTDNGNNRVLIFESQ